MSVRETHESTGSRAGPGRHGACLSARVLVFWAQSRPFCCRPQG